MMLGPKTILRLLRMVLAGLISFVTGLMIGLQQGPFLASDESDVSSMLESSVRSNKGIQRQENLMPAFQTFHALILCSGLITCGSSELEEMSDRCLKSAIACVKNPDSYGVSSLFLALNSKPSAPNTPFEVIIRRAIASRSRNALETSWVHVASSSSPSMLDNATDLDPFSFVDDKVKISVLQTSLRKYEYLKNVSESVFQSKSDRIQLLNAVAMAPRSKLSPAVGTVTKDGKKRRMASVIVRGAVAGMPSWMPCSKRVVTGESKCELVWATTIDEVAANSKVDIISIDSSSDALDAIMGADHVLASASIVLIKYNPNDIIHRSDFLRRSLTNSETSDSSQQSDPSGVTLSTGSTQGKLGMDVTRVLQLLVSSGFSLFEVCRSASRQNAGISDFKEVWWNLEPIPENFRTMQPWALKMVLQNDSHSPMFQPYAMRSPVTSRIVALRL